MRRLLLAFIMVCGCLNVAIAEQKVGVLMPAVENIGTVVDFDNASGSLTISGKRYQLTNDTVIHYAPGEDVRGYKDFKFAKDMDVGFKLENAEGNAAEPRISEVWVLYK